LDSTQQIVLILDDDLGFVFWLGHALDESGLAAFPARSTPDAKVLLRELKFNPDLLIVNPALPGTAEFIDELRRSAVRLKVIAITQDVRQRVEPRLGAVATGPKPRGPDETSKSEWLRLIQSVLMRNANAGRMRN
jgi:DNA-binding response OmpR family regulator